MASFTWNAKAKRYRNTSTGRFMPLSQVRVFRVELTVDAEAAIARATEKLVNSESTTAEWVSEVRDTLKASWGAQYAVGRGGINAMSKTDWGRVGAMVKSQYGYLQRFAQSVASGTLSAAQIGARAALYAAASSAGFSHGQSAAYDGLRLPVQPCDGGTACLMNCQCHWDIIESPARWSCTWVLGNAEHCNDCLDRADQYNPYEQEKTRSDAA